MPRLVPLLAATLVACGSSTPTHSDPFPAKSSGDYAYTAYGPSGRVELVGTMHLDLLAWPADDQLPPSFGGTWSIHWAPDADTTLPLGPQIGAGTLQGWSDEHGVRIELAPAMVDNNVGLGGIASGEELSGTWTWSTIAGPSERGRFRLNPVP